MSSKPDYNLFIFLSVRFVWIDDTLQVKNFRVSLPSYYYADYQRFFHSIATSVGFDYDPKRWHRFQAIIDRGYGTPKTVYERSNPGPIHVPADTTIALIFFNRTMWVPVQLRLGEAWQAPSPEIWSFPMDIEMTVRQLKEYLLKNPFQIPERSVLNAMRAVASNHFTEAKLQEALNQNGELSTFSLSYYYDGGRIEYLDGARLIVQMYTYESPKHASPHIIFSVTPMLYW